MDFYLSNISQVPKENVPIKGTKGAKIQWLITKNEGAHYAVRKFSLEKMGVIPMHAHKYQETVIITKGKCKVCVADKEFELKEGDYIFIDSQVKHAIMAEDELEFFCVIDYVDDMSIKTLNEDCP
ncbi:cupin domain-containing protein [Acidianus ambivalens]|uniref:Cupin domain-containing protein n=1 Tax=Acidianus ambivalens TaxID=2283 RepID=A0A650CWK7_ACIAM|nr:cupin domain-containing protein [Acidianus ambivalens]MQL54450.1 cupin domain-containing protein [Acidianus ambivalens]QGR22269.1 cupin domain-containing protein [Acidianus ambivalens]